MNEPQKSHQPEKGAAPGDAIKKDEPKKAPGFQQDQSGLPGGGSARTPAGQPASAKPAGSANATPQTKTASS